MIQKIQKWGNSMGVRLPKKLTDQYALQEGGTVILVAEKNKISLRPITNRKKNLKELVASITAKNRHKEIGWGKLRGKEVW